MSAPARRSAPHGTLTRYQAPCRCTACRAEHTRAQNRRRLALAEGRPLTQDGTGTRRRLQALSALGHTSATLAVRLGLTPSRVRELATETCRVRASTYERVAALYDDLSMVPGASDRTRAIALRRGWVPPLAWDDDEIDDPIAVPHVAPRPTGVFLDEVAVGSVLAGYRCRLSTPERHEVLPVLVARGLSDKQVADLVGCAPETVLRNRKALGLPSGWSTAA